MAITSMFLQSAVFLHGDILVFLHLEMNKKAIGLFYEQDCTFYNINKSSFFNLVFISNYTQENGF